MSATTGDEAAWAARAIERSPSVQRSRARSVEHARLIIAAARRLVTEQGESFTTQELVKEAGVSLQTFYKCFAGKDELLLAVIEDLVTEQAAVLAAAAAGLADPVERLRSYVTTVVGALLSGLGDQPQARFIPTEHWRLLRLFPDEMERATAPFVDLVREEVDAARAAGALPPGDSDRDAWLVTHLVMAVFHHFTFVGAPDEAMADDVWRFCLRALGGGQEPGGRRRRRT